MILATILITLFLSSANAQHSEQPQMESNSDLRTQKTMFSVEIPKDKTIYYLERTSGQDYLLRRRVSEKDTIQKLAGSEALRIDREFSSKFLKCQYEILNLEGPCEVTLRLTMKGEEQDICKKDDKKGREFVSFIDELAKRF